MDGNHCHLQCRHWLALLQASEIYIIISIVLMDVQEPETNDKGQKVKLKTKIYQWLIHYPGHESFTIDASPISGVALYYIRLSAMVYFGFTSIWVLSSLRSLAISISQLQYICYLLSYIYFLCILQDYFFNRRNKLFPIASNLKFYILIIFEMAFCSQLALTPYLFSKLHMITQDSSTTIVQLALIYNLLLGPLVWLFLELIFNSYPFPIKHFIFPITLVTILFSSNSIYHNLIESPYQLVHWDRIQDYLFMSLSIILLVLSFLCGRLLFVRWKQRKLKEREDIIEVALIDRIVGARNSNQSYPQGHSPQVLNQELDI